MIDSTKLNSYIERYVRDFDNPGPDGKIWWKEEKYKWQAIRAFHDNWNLDADNIGEMLTRSLKPAYNLLETGSKRSRSMIVDMAHHEPETIRGMFQTLFNDSKEPTAIYSLIQDFKSSAESILQKHYLETDHHYQDENTISTYLWLWDPSKYYIYKISLLKVLASELAPDYKFVASSASYEQNLNNAFNLYQDIREAIIQNEELISFIDNHLQHDKSCDSDKEHHTLVYDIAYFIYRDNTGWIPEEYDPGITVDEWKGLLTDTSVFDDISLQIVKQLKDFGGRATCSQLSAEYGESPNYYKNTFVSLAKRVYNKVQCPLYNSADDDESGYYWPILFLGKPASKKDKGVFIWRLRETLDEALEDLADERPEPGRLYHQSSEKQPPNFKNPYSITLLKSKNLIFHGAPGTGKTYLAKQIAADIISNGSCNSYEQLSDEQKKQVGFVQFHPSYDYTDFVEGLRPVIHIDGSMGFELRDGIFKEFVDRARKNYEISHKSEKEIEKELSVQEAMDDYFDSFELNVDYLETRTGNKFTITEIVDNHITVFIPDNPIVKHLSLSINELRSMLESGKTFSQVKDITEFFGKRYGLQAYSYYLSIYQAIRNHKGTLKKTKALKIEEKKYVFIIDEINRGEISKIFGELFYTIDPGCRGRAGEISTQYSNMHTDPTQRFYIPDNVYILGTMNDIDRSVDSFDFAMRRRFRFVEIMAETRLEMLDVLTNKEEAIKHMKALNSRIIAKDTELNENYQIGPAYFLKLKSMSFEQLWTDSLEPLLREYVRGMLNEEELMNGFADAYGYKKLTEGDADEAASD